MMHFFVRFIICLILSAALAASPAGMGGFQDAYAKTTKQSAKKKPVQIKKSGNKKRSKAQRLQPAPSSATDNSRHAALVVNANTGELIYESNATGIRHPASLTKMMTLYLLFESLSQGKLRMDSMLPVSSKAASQAPTNMRLEAGDTIPVRTAIDALIVRSANDVAMAVAEALGGTEFNFALMMNQRARQLGMKNTVFHNPSGLPDTRQVSTALDLAKLAIALRRDFPQYYP